MGKGKAPSPPDPEKLSKVDEPCEAEIVARQAQDFVEKCKFEKQYPTLKGPINWKEQEK